MNAQEERVNDNIVSMTTENQGVRHFQELLNRLYHFSTLTTNTLTLEDLEQVRRCWEEVFFTEKSAFNDDKYEDFQFVVNWFDDTAEPKTYHGLRSVSETLDTNNEILPASSTPSADSSSSLVPEHILKDIQQCVGDDTKIKSLLEEMDTCISNDNILETAEATGTLTDTNESSSTDVSCKISLINKIRTLLDEHSDLVSAIPTKSDLTERVYKWYYNDMYYREKETSANEISYDEEFRHMYIYGFTTLLASLDTSDTGKMQKLKIRRASESMVESFLSRVNVLLLYDLHAIHEFHQKVWGVVKFCFRNNEDCDEICSEIENYSVLNPIFSILKPLVRQLLDEESRSYDSSSIENSQSGNENTRQISIRQPTVTDNYNIPHLEAPINKKIEVIPVKRLIPLIEKAINLSNETIGSLRRLPKLVKIYVSLLVEEGIQPEMDPFYCNISKFADQWVNGEITAVEFYSELYSFSLIPLSRDSDDASLNNMQLRLAYMISGRELYLERQYFIKLIDAYSSLKNVYTTPDKANLYVGPIFKTWHAETVKYANLAVQGNNALQKLQEKTAFSVWKQKYKYILTLRSKADSKMLKHWFCAWKARYSTLTTELDNRLQKFEHSHLERKYFNALVLDYRFRKWETKNSGAIFAVKQVFNKWKSQADNYKCLLEQADDRNEKFLETFIWVCWKHRSLGKFKIDTLLADTEKQYTSARYLNIWKRQLHYERVKKEVEKHNKVCMEKYAFNQWQSIYKLHTRSLELQHRTSLRKLKAFFVFWKNAHKMRQLADEKHRAFVTKHCFETWLLELHFVYSLSNANVHIAQNMLDRWRLKARGNKFQKQSETKMVVIFFNIWKSKYDNVKKLNGIFSGRVQELQVGIYFEFWRRSTEDQTAKRERFEKSVKLIRENHEKSLLRRMLSTWRRKLILREREAEVETEKLHEFESERILRPEFHKWLKRCVDIRRNESSADMFYDNLLKLKYMLKLLNGYDCNLQLMELYQNHSNLKDLELLKRVMSQISLKMIKYRTDYRNADLFKARWAKISKDAFFGIWKMKFDARKSARKQKKKEQQLQQHQEDLSGDAFNRTLTSMNSYGSLRNPYIDTTDTMYSDSRLSSPLTERTAATTATKLTSWKTSSTADLLQAPNLAPDSPTSFSRISPPKLFRTPMRKVNMSLSSSAKRVRRFNLEQRVNHYRQAKKSPEKGEILRGSEDSTAPPTPTKPSRIAMLEHQRR